ncbi:DUF29 family protein [Caenispirillum salinarum]|uniref:DUF29 family protein n=1 Tax=Caenispirillum salinarum TaxID=859058 RepID=UPI00384F0596
MRIDASLYRVAIASVLYAAEYLRRLPDDRAPIHAVLLATGRHNGASPEPARAIVGGRLRAALAGRASPDELTPEEHAAWLEAFSKKMSEPTPEEEAYFAERRRRGVGVGLDEAGRLIRASDRLHDLDFEAWTREQSSALRRAAASHPTVFAEIDVPTVVEELKGLGRQAAREVYDRLVVLFEMEILLAASDGAAVDLNAEAVDVPVTQSRRRLWRAAVAGLENDVAIRAQGIPALAAPARFETLIEKAWRDGRRRAQSCPVAAVAARVAGVTPATCPDVVGKRLEARVRPQDGLVEVPRSDT